MRPLQIKLRWTCKTTQMKVKCSTGGRRTAQRDLWNVEESSLLQTTPFMLSWGKQRIRFYSKRRLNILVTATKAAEKLAAPVAQ